MIVGSFVSVKAHVDLSYSQEKSGNVQESENFGCKKHPKFSIKHICSMHPEKLAFRFGKNKFLTLKAK